LGIVHNTRNTNTQKENRNSRDKHKNIRTSKRKNQLQHHTDGEGTHNTWTMPKEGTNLNENMDFKDEKF
jgi:hypothetical protein